MIKDLILLSLDFRATAQAGAWGLPQNGELCCSLVVGTGCSSLLGFTGERICCALRSHTLGTREKARGHKPCLALRMPVSNETDVTIFLCQAAAHSAEVWEAPILTTPGQAGRGPLLLL